MLGWHISVYRQADGGASPATHLSKRGKRLAVWQTGLNGLGWLDELVKEDKAIDLGGDGYPSYYTASAERLLSQILAGPPLAHESWHRDEYDTVTEDWAGRTVVDQAEVSNCPPDEWLLVVVWDES